MALKAEQRADQRDGHILVSCVDTVESTASTASRLETAYEFHTMSGTLVFNV